MYVRVNAEFPVSLFNCCLLEKWISLSVFATSFYRSIWGEWPPARLYKWSPVSLLCVQVFVRRCELFNYTRFKPYPVDYVLVYQSEEDWVSVVLYKRRLGPKSTLACSNLGKSLNSVGLAPALSYEMATATSVYTPVLVRVQVWVWHKYRYGR